MVKKVLHKNYLHILRYNTDKTSIDPLETLEKAVRNATPLVEVKARRVGGSTYQVPMEIRAYRGTNLALRWLTQFAAKDLVKIWPINWLTKLWMLLMIMDIHKKKRRNSSYG